VSVGQERVLKALSNGSPQNLVSSLARVKSEFALLVANASEEFLTASPHQENAKAIDDTLAKAGARVKGYYLEKLSTDLGSAMATLTSQKVKKQEDLLEACKTWDTTLQGLCSTLKGESYASELQKLVRSDDVAPFKAAMAKISNTLASWQKSVPILLLEKEAAKEGEAKDSGKEGATNVPFRYTSGQDIKAAVSALTCFANAFVMFDDKCLMPPLATALPTGKGTAMHEWTALSKKLTTKLEVVVSNKQPWHLINCFRDVDI